MRRIFTFITFLFATCLNSFGQCTSPATFTTASTFPFAAGFEGFTSSNFTWGSGILSSTNISAGTSKQLTSATLIQPSGPGNVSWGFDLSRTGSANVTGYAVSVVYFNGSIQTIALCSVVAPMALGTNTFSAPAPAQIQGQSFQLQITLTVAGGGGNNISIDNFVSSAVTSGTVLPVKFSSLDTRTTDNATSLKWVVATEDNVIRFEIEKSIDGHEYSNIGFVNATGQNSYSFVDTRVSTTAYYRVKSVDVNGRYTYSPIATVKEGKSMIQLKAFPSPFTKNVSVQHATAGAGSLITISSEDGRLLKSIAPIIGTQQTPIDLSTAKAGLYLIRFNNNNGTTETLKVVKQ
jgi:hypothetical protein